MVEMDIKIYFLGAFIISVIGGILMLTTEFGGWYGVTYLGYGSYLYEWGSISAFSGPGGALLILMAIFLFYCSVISVLGLIDPDKIPNKLFILVGVFLSILVFIITLISGAIFVIAVWDAAEWWFGAAFYAGIISGILTPIFLFLAWKNIE